MKTKTAIKNFLQCVIQEAKEDLAIDKNDKFAQEKLDRALNFDLDNLQAAINWSYELGFSENRNDTDFIEEWK